MEFRNLEIKVHSCNDLKDIGIFKGMDVYVVGSIYGDERTKQRTPVVKHAGSDPRWDNLRPMKFVINEAWARQNQLTLHFKIKADRGFGDKHIGDVYVPVKELLDGADVDGKTEKWASFSVRARSGKTRGVINLSYKFGEIFVSGNSVEQGKKIAEDVPVMAYPPGMGSGGSSGAYPSQYQGGYYPPPPQTAYPPHQPAYPPQQRYGYPPQGGPGYGYGYQQQAPGYGGYPPQPATRKNNNAKLGLGIGAGLLGGLLIGDMVSDVGEMSAYDAGFDDGFDAGGFDF